MFNAALIDGEFLEDYILLDLPTLDEVVSHVLHTLGGWTRGRRPDLSSFAVVIRDVDQGIVVTMTRNARSDVVTILKNDNIFEQVDASILRRAVA